MLHTQSNSVSTSGENARVKVLVTSALVSSSPLELCAQKLLLSLLAGYLSEFKYPFSTGCSRVLCPKETLITFELLHRIKRSIYQMKALFRYIL